MPSDITDPEVDDVLDDLAEPVLRMKGDVVVVPVERLPSATGAAATYRHFSWLVPPFRRCKY